MRQGAMRPSARNCLKGDVVEIAKRLAEAFQFQRRIDFGDAA